MADSSLQHVEVSDNYSMHFVYSYHPFLRCEKRHAVDKTSSLQVSLGRNNDRHFPVRLRDGAARRVFLQNREKPRSRMLGHRLSRFCRMHR